MITIDKSDTAQAEKEECRCSLQKRKWNHHIL